MNEILPQEKIDLLQDEYDDLVDKAIALENALNHQERISYTTKLTLFDIERRLYSKALDYALSPDENILLNILKQFREDEVFQKKILKIMEEE